MTDFTAGAWLAEAPHITSTAAFDAWIIGSISRHDRLTAHSGFEADIDITLSGPIGRYPTGTTVRDVLIDLVDRVAAMSNVPPTIGTFSAAAFVQPVIRARAVISAMVAAGATANAVIGYGGSVAADAVIFGPPTGKVFPTMQAFIIEDVS